MAKGPISFSCVCGQTIKVRTEYVGSPVKCPSCKATVKVPDLTADPDAVAAPIGPTGRSAPQVAVSPRRADESGDPWYYAVVLFAAISLFLFGTFQFVVVGLWWFKQENASASETTTAMTSGLIFLGTLWILGFSKVLVEIARSAKTTA